MADMADRFKWEGRWDQLKGRAKQMWGDLTDDDMDVAEGNMDELIGRIKERTGESVESIQRRLADVSGELRDRF
ncbi:MAG: CsbD family protein [Actinomycetes bacterium]|jgi:uncharacterized protein YjbJ (UPF0337 family)|nr:CsbD family protein [Acidimicrobiia bacterium]